MEQSAGQGTRCAMAAAASRAPSQLARRDALSLTAPRLRLGCRASCPTVAAVTPRIGRSRAVPCCGSAGLSRASNCGVLGLPTVTPVRFVGREHRQCDRGAWQSGIARENAVRTMLVMAVARCTITAGATARVAAQETLKMLVCGRMDRCIQQYLK